MSVLFLTFALLGIASDGGRLHRSNKKTKGRPYGKQHASAPSPQTIKSKVSELAEFMVAMNPGAGWQVSSSGEGASSLQSHYSHYAASSLGAVLSGRGQTAPSLHTARTMHAPQMIWAPTLKTGGFFDTASLAGLTCRLSLNVGREPGSLMPADWSASGARLLLPVPVTFSGESFGTEGDPESHLGPCEKWHHLKVNGAATFVSSHGLEHVAVNDGAWSVAPSGHKSGELLVRFYLDFPAGAVRNDVELPAGRVFFSASTWPEAELSAARTKAADLEEQVSELTGVFQKKTEASDSKSSALERARAFRDSTEIYDKLKISSKSLKYLTAGIPSSEDVMGIPNSIFDLGKQGGLHIKRRGPARRFFAQEYHAIGTFTFNDLVSSDPQIEHESKQLLASTV